MKHLLQIEEGTGPNEPSLMRLADLESGRTIDFLYMDREVIGRAVSRLIRRNLPISDLMVHEDLKEACIKTLRKLGTEIILVEDQNEGSK